MLKSAVLIKKEKISSIIPGLELRNKANEMLEETYKKSIKLIDAAKEKKDLKEEGKKELEEELNKNLNLADSKIDFLVEHGENEDQKEFKEWKDKLKKEAEIFLNEKYEQILQLPNEKARKKAETKLKKVDEEVKLLINGDKKRNKKIKYITKIEIEDEISRILNTLENSVRKMLEQNKGNGNLLEKARSEAEKKLDDYFKKYGRTKDIWREKKSIMERIDLTISEYQDIKEPNKTKKDLKRKIGEIFEELKNIYENDAKKSNDKNYDYFTTDIQEFINKEKQEILKIKTGSEKINMFIAIHMKYIDYFTKFFFEAFSKIDEKISNKAKIMIIDFLRTQKKLIFDIIKRSKEVNFIEVCAELINSVYNLEKSKLKLFLFMYNFPEIEMEYFEKYNANIAMRPVMLNIYEYEKRNLGKTGKIKGKNVELLENLKREELDYKILKLTDEYMDNIDKYVNTIIKQGEEKIKYDEIFKEEEQDKLFYEILNNFQNEYEEYEKDKLIDKENLNDVKKVGKDEEDEISIEELNKVSICATRKIVKNILEIDELNEQNSTKKHRGTRKKLVEIMEKSLVSRRIFIEEIKLIQKEREKIKQNPEKLKELEQQIMRLKEDYIKELKIILNLLELYLYEKEEKDNKVLNKSL